jgi:hypothetical protein
MGATSLPPLAIPPIAHDPPALDPPPPIHGLHPSPSASLLRPPSRAPPELAGALSLEAEAKRLAASQQRSLSRLAPRASAQLLCAKRRARATSVRAELATHTGKAFTATMRSKFHDLRLPTDEEVGEVATLLNAALCRLYPEERSQACFFRLFKAMDEDCSGLVSYQEFVRTVRGLLRIDADQLSRLQLQCVWRWVDEDASGMISCGEFSRLLRRGWHGFLAEYEQLRCAGHRNTWSHTAHLLEAPWVKDANAPAENRNHTLNAAKALARDNTRKFQAASDRFRSQQRAWTERLTAMEDGEGAKTAYYGRSKAVQRKTASMPLLQPLQ